MTENERIDYERKFGVKYVKTGSYKDYEFGYYKTGSFDKEGRKIINQYKFKETQNSKRQDMGY